LNKSYLADELTETERQVLLCVHENDAYWTSDIAKDARMSTAQTRRVLQRLEEYGEIERIVKGNPTSWRRVPFST
jgi:DNA-binding MarR family transcriptional regulator